MNCKASLFDESIEDGLTENSVIVMHDFLNADEVRSFDNELSHAASTILQLRFS
jgi:hypothetical protein